MMLVAYGEEGPRTTKPLMPLMSPLTASATPASHQADALSRPITMTHRRRSVLACGLRLGVPLSWFSSDLGLWVTKQEYSEGLACG
jgi:hypothetical protein